MNDITKKFVNEFNLELVADDEEFKYISGSKNYYVSNYGRIILDKSRTRNNYIKICDIKDDKKNMDLIANIGYWESNRSHRKVVGKLVAETFIPNPNSFKFIRYKDNDYTNNHVDNIEWFSKRKIINYNENSRPKHKLSYYNTPVFIKEMCLWSLWDTIENAANSYKININDILDITNNEEKTGTIKGISQFGIKYDVTFSFRIPKSWEGTEWAAKYNNLISKNK